MPIRLFLAAALALLPAQHAASGTPYVAFSTDGMGAVIVPVRINGAAPVPFLLDTGSTHSVVSSALADRQSLPFVARTEVLTSAGRELRPVVRIESTSIGLTTAEALRASVVSAEHLRAISSGIEGVIGQDFLFAFNYTLDYRNKRLTWGAQQGAGWTGTRVAVVRQQGRLLAPLAATGSRTPLLFVVDSGAEQFVIYERGGRTGATLDPSPGSVEVLGMSRRLKARVAMLPELRLGTLRLTRRPVIVLDRTGIDASEGDGLLPLHVFSSVSIYAQDGYMVVRP